MGTKTYNAATDMITFSRASGGTALRKVSYGNELVTNGTFIGTGNVTGWTLDGDAINNNGVDVFDVTAGAATNVIATQTVALTIGGVYQLSFERITGTDDSSISAAAAGLTTLYSSAVGVETRTFVATASSALFLINSGSGSMTVLVDNVSVKEVTFDQADGTLELFNHPDDIPRIEYDAAGAVKGLLIEEARTNLLTYSSEFDNAAWINTGTSSISPNTQVSPSGATTADTFTSDGAADYLFPTNTGLFSAAGGADYTCSGYFKAGTATTIQLLVAATSTYQATYNLSTGDVTGISANTLAGAVDVGGGWYRCYITCIGVANTVYTEMQIGRVSSGLTFGIYGAQLEVGSFASSYIPTSGASATRAADIATIPTSAFGYNAEGGTVVVDFNMSFDGTNYPRVWEIGSTINNQDRINVFGYAPTAIIGTGLYTAGTSQAGVSVSTGNTVPTGPVKVAFAWRENDIAFIQDGGTVIADNTATITGGNPRTVLALGGTTAPSTDYLNGHIKSIQYYPRRLTNAQLQELTT